MDARTYLEELWQIDRRIRDKQELRDHYLSMACRSTAAFGGGLTGGSLGDGPVAEYGIKLMDIDRELEEDVRRLQERCHTAREAIRRLPDPRQRDVLELHYFHGMGWEEIAAHLHYERTQVWRMHTRALGAVSAYLGCNAQRRAT